VKLLSLARRIRLYGAAYSLAIAQLILSLSISGLGHSGKTSLLSFLAFVFKYSFSFLSAQKMASPNSRCATFTNEADGFVLSLVAKLFHDF